METPQNFDWDKLIGLRKTPKVKVTKVPILYKKQFRNAKEYNAFLENQRKQIAQ